MASLDCPSCGWAVNENNVSDAYGCIRCMERRIQGLTDALEAYKEVADQADVQCGKVLPDEWHDLWTKAYSVELQALDFTSHKRKKKRKRK